MKTHPQLSQLNPVGPTDAERWTQSRQSVVRAGIDEQRSHDDYVAVPVEKSASRPRSQMWGAAAAIALIAGVAIALTQQPASVPTATTDLALEPPIELSGDGAVWLSHASRVDDAAREFASATVGWVEPGITTNTDDVGPVWVTVRSGEQAMELLFVPADTFASQWVLMQVGSGGGSYGFGGDGNTVLRPGPPPARAASALVIVGDGTRTERIDVDEPTGTSIALDFVARASVVFYFDADGALLDARGGHT